jgi:hypothetical protein
MRPQAAGQSLPFRSIFTGYDEAHNLNAIAMHSPFRMSLPLVEEARLAPKARGILP